jgi:hypothetical protein
LIPHAGEQHRGGRSSASRADDNGVIHALLLASTPTRAG